MPGRQAQAGDRHGVPDPQVIEALDELRQRGTVGPGSRDEPREKPESQDTNGSQAPHLFILRAGTE
jgi:hypothetical protein